MKQEPKSLEIGGASNTESISLVGQKNFIMPKNYILLKIF